MQLWCQLQYNYNMIVIPITVIVSTFDMCRSTVVHNRNCNIVLQLWLWSALICVAVYAVLLLVLLVWMAHYDDARRKNKQDTFIQNASIFTFFLETEVFYMPRKSDLENARSAENCFVWTIKTYWKHIFFFCLPCSSTIICKVTK